MASPRALVTPVLVAALLVPWSTTTAVGATPSEAETPTMGDYPASDYEQAAAELPPDLVAAVERDLAISAEEYLAQADAASDASDLVEHLAEQGIDASDRRLEGTTLTIGVASESQAAIVEDAGAVAVVGELPAPDAIAPGVVLEPAVDVLGGDMIAWANGSGGTARCSVGVNGTNASSQPEFVTAGHCTSATLGNGGLYRHYAIGAPGFSPTGSNVNVGGPRPGSFRAGGGYDVGLIRVSQPGFTTPPTVTTYGGGLGARASALLTVRDTLIPTTGSPVCKSGATTGWTCGQITDAARTDLIVGAGPTAYTVDAFVTNVCMLGGDSGGPAMVGTAFVGVNSASAFAVGRESQITGYSGTPVDFCAAAPSQQKVSAMAIMRHETGIRTIETLYGSTWEPSVVVDRPTANVPAFYTPGSGITVTGAVSNGTPRTRIVVTVNGSAYSATPSGPNGDWSVTTGSVGGSSAQVTVQARWGQRSSSDTLSYVVSAVLSDPPKVERISGEDRYDVAIGVSQRAYPGPARPATVYIVNGADYPDALSAGSAAAATGGLVMLVPTTAVPDRIIRELQRLSPQRVIIVGGPASVSDGVRVTVTNALPAATVSRISGEDRFEVSRRVLSETPEFDTAANVYVSNGYNYPDALVAGAAGSSQVGLSPVLIVPGIDTSLPSSTVAAVVAEGFSTIKIAGGPASVTDAIRTQLAGIPGVTVTRLGGIDRYEAARSVANDAYPGTASTVFLTTGVNFPDALAGAPLAGLLNAPMYSVETTCVPRAVLVDIARLNPRTIVLLGGTGTLTPAVAALTPCP